MSTILLLALLLGLAAWLAHRQPSPAMVLVTLVILLLLAVKAFGLHLVLGAWLTRLLGLHAALGLADRQIGKLLAGLLIGGLLLAMAVAAFASARPGPARHAAWLTVALLLGMGLAFAIDYLEPGRAVSTPAGHARHELVEALAELMVLIMVLLGWYRFCSAPQMLIDRRRRVALLERRLELLEP